eukprot:364991-Chlamydomonas_euryale.AAC.22
MRSEELTCPPHTACLAHPDQIPPLIPHAGCAPVVPVLGHANAPALVPNAGCAPITLVLGGASAPALPQAGCAWRVPVLRGASAPALVPSKFTLRMSTMDVSGIIFAVAVATLPLLSSPSASPPVQVPR